MRYISGILFITFLSCTSSTVHNVEKEESSSIIPIGEALKNAKLLNLSEVVDSITYIPIETSSNHLLKILEDGLWAYNSPFFIYFGGSVFDKNGQFIRKVGKVGQGPGEEISRWGYSAYYDKKRNLFYTRGDKLIQFDGDGHFTGKEIRLTYRESSGNAIGGFKNIYAFAKAGNNYVLANYPDSLFWLNSELNVLKNKRVLPDSLHLNVEGAFNALVYPSFSVYRDTTLFYNCFTDTVYSVTSEDLQKRWVIDMCDLKPSNKVFLNDCHIYLKEMVEIGRSSHGNPAQMKIKAENSNLAKLIDKKKWVSAVYESHKYVILRWSTLIAFANWRGMEESHYPQLAFYDKKSKSILVAAGRGLVDDIDGGPVFFPKHGVGDECMISSIWPYELKEYVANKSSKGEKVSAHLVELAGSLKEDDNPVLIVAHLKK